MGLLLLVRHGQASFGADDYDVLSPTGHEQARATGEAWREVAPDVVVHGSLRRQRETAASLIEAAGWDVPVEVDAAWDEIDHVAMLARVPRPDGVAFQEWYELATDRWTSGEHADYAETYAAFVGRAIGALERVADRGRVVVVTSGGPIAVLASLLLRGDATTYRTLAPVMVNASVSRVVAGVSGARLVSLNEHGHLARELVTYR